MKISDLKAFVDKTVTLRMTDGEVIKARVDWFSEEYDDIIVDVLESTRSQPYDPACAYTIAAAEIVQPKSLPKDDLD